MSVPDIPVPDQKRFHVHYQQHHLYIVGELHDEEVLSLNAIQR
jgi:hypothetical protein